MKKTVVLLGLLLFGLSTKAQEQASDRVQQFRDLIEESVNYYTSDEYRASIKIYEEFSDKVHSYETKPPLQGGEQMDFMDWLTENLSLTKFKTVEEGVQLLYKWEDTSMAVVIKKEELYQKKEKLLAQLSREEIAELFDEITSIYIQYEAIGINRFNDMVKEVNSISDVTVQVKP